jgi:glyoxylase-like metal-dependent hydrolase (beta-lactamase superfamily II)
VDSGGGLILVDSGYGRRDYSDPTPLVRAFNIVIGLEKDIRQTAFHQVQALGYDPDQVKHIFLTHMHLDHTGGLPDFPLAKVHVFRPELEQALHGAGFLRHFYIDRHRAHGPDWQIYDVNGDWFGFPRTEPVRIGEVELFYVPMVGHSPGSCMVVLRLPDDRWLIHAGDTYGFHGQVEPDHPFYPRYQRLFRPLFSLLHVTRSFFNHDEKIRHLRKELGERLEIFNAHDPHDYERLSGKLLQ